MKIKEAILQLLEEQPELTNAEVAAAMRAAFDGAKTTPQTVATIKSQQRRMARENGEATPTPDISSIIYAMQQPASAVTALEDLGMTQNETPEERDARIAERYAYFERITALLVASQLDGGLIVSGPPGLGKSFTVERELKRAKIKYTSLRGSISAAGLYLTLWNNRDGFLVLDDIDAVFDDIEALNLLKAVLDTTGTRRVSWQKQAQWLESEDIPQSFDFNGTIAFCTNIDFEVAIKRNNRVTPHLRAFMDRAFYLSLSTRTLEDVLTRIRQVVVGSGIEGVEPEQAEDVMAFIEANATRFNSLSIRLAVQIATLTKTFGDDWKAAALMLKARELD